MADYPYAYFITFSTYGTWLHGDAPGSVNREHNRVGTPWIPPDEETRLSMRSKLTQEPYFLDETRRAIVCDAIIEECRFRGWELHALHVRSNHVHLVVTAAHDPEFVMRSCKARASKCLNQAGLDGPDRKRWTTHGSTKYLWTEDAAIAAVEYTLHRQGEPMAVFTKADNSKSNANPIPSPSASEEL